VINSKQAFANTYVECIRARRLVGATPQVIGDFANVGLANPESAHDIVDFCRIAVDAKCLRIQHLDQPIRVWFIKPK